MITINATGDTTIHTAGKYCPEDILVKIPPSAPATELVTETAACSITGQMYATNAGAFGSYSNSTCYAGANTSNYYAYVMKFRTPTFKGTSKSINFTLNIKSNYHANISLNYALATSDANKDSYKRTYASVSDSNQITSGLLTMNSMSTSSYGNWPLDISTSALQAETDYYLFLWGTSNSTLTTVNNATDHTIMLEYEYEKAISGGSGGASVETCTVTITFGGTLTTNVMLYAAYTTFEDGIVAAKWVQPPLSSQTECAIECIKGSCLVVRMGDYADSCTSHNCTLLKSTFMDYIFSVDEDNASIALALSSGGSGGGGN